MTASVDGPAVRSCSQKGNRWDRNSERGAARCRRSRRCLVWWLDWHGV